MTTDLRTMTILDPRVLAPPEVGRPGPVAVSVAGYPDIFPSTSSSTTGPSSAPPRARSWRRPCSAAVAFEADGLDTRGEAWSVVVKDGRSSCKRVDLFEATGLPLFPWLASPKPRFVRIVPDAVTGRAFRVGGQGG
jgi:hypothetical protein